MDPRRNSISRRWLEEALEATSVGVVITDSSRPDDPIIYVNSAFETLTGYESEEIIGRNCRFLQAPDSSEERVAALRTAVDASSHTSLRLLNSRKDGSTFWNELTISPIHDDTQEVVGFVGFQNDVSAEVHLRRALDEKVKALEQTQRSLEAANSELRRLAYRDTLTGLPTRRLFDDRLDQSLARCKRTGDTLAIAFMDLDGFKQVNDRFGHEAGDDVLRIAAERVRAQIRSNDTLARLGGDEYVLLFDNGVSDDEVAEVCRRIAHGFSDPIDLEGVPLQLGVSIGTAIYPRDGEDAKSLMRSADAAMYQAKARKKAEL